MKFQILVIAFAVTAVAAAPSQLDQQWSSFKQQFNKRYVSAYEEQFRKSIFADNVEMIERHNEEFRQGQHSYDLAVNEFADMTLPEFRRRSNGVIVSPGTVMAPEVFHATRNQESLPAEVDWTKKGVVTPIKNQGNCGSCWAFSAVASMESAHALKTGKLVSLSEQELVDCSGSEGNMGCTGGWMDNAFRFVLDHPGIDTEASYPYTGADEECTDQSNRTIGATIRKFVDIERGNENALQEAVATIGPISVAIDASSNHFMFYKSGVYDYTDCSTDMLDHGVAVVGYGTMNGKQYWKVKNSWGTTWGENGYIFMSRNKDNQCGIATKASYPVV